MISVIIPVFNEDQNIRACLESLKGQNSADFEIIVVDDGSTDTTIHIVENLVNKVKNLRIYKLTHKGPARARNYGAKKAKGDILVFVDGDMTFSADFLANLTAPIIKENTLGTFTKNEFISNWKNAWARCWNYNQNLKDKRRIPENFPDESPVFRAIKKSVFDSVNGFDSIGYTDDWTLSRKIGKKAKLARSAVCYHQNPDTLTNIFIQARWIGKNEFLNLSYKKIINLIRFSLPLSLAIGIAKSIIYREPRFVFFKIIYDWGILMGIIDRTIYKNVY